MRALVWKRAPWRTRHWLQLLVYFAFTWVVEAARDHGLWFHAALIVWIGMLARLPSHLPSRPFFGESKPVAAPEAARPATDELG